jgi:hypothetical protein
MTAPDAGVGERIAAVLSEHEDPPGWTDAPDGLGQGDLVYECSCGDQSPTLAHDGIGEADTQAAADWHRAHVAAALAPIVADEVSAAEVRALREAAGAWQQGEWINIPHRVDPAVSKVAAGQHVTDWLRDRLAAHTDGGA